MGVTGMTRRRVSVAVVTVALTAAGFLGVQFLGIGPQAIDVCVSGWEDGNGQGDKLTICDTPVNLKVPNLGTHTEGLHNGCNRAVNQSSTWADCISSVKVEVLPGNYRVAWFQNTAYGGTRVYCVDANGTTPILNLPGAANDVISSFRVEGGNC